jgi:hypothetical protein
MIVLINNLIRKFTCTVSIFLALGVGKDESNFLKFHMNRLLQVFTGKIVQLAPSHFPTLFFVPSCLFRQAS